MRSRNVKIVVFVPERQADLVRRAAGQAGAGSLGNYTFCSFSCKGVGRFLPKAGANPAIGQVGRLESVKEERVEMICEEKLVAPIIAAIKKVHPYEEPAIEVFPLLEY